MSKLEEKIQSLVEQKIQSIGYELYDVEYVKEGKNYFLRIYIDKEGGIDLNDCEKVNDAISDLLDEANYIKEQYFLEISSPGIERTLKNDKHLKQNIGSNIEIKLFKKDENGKKEYIGILEEFDSNNITIKQEEVEAAIDRKNIAHIKTIYNW